MLLPLVTPLEHTMVTILMTQKRIKQKRTSTDITCKISQIRQFHYGILGGMSSNVFYYIKENETVQNTNIRYTLFVGLES